MYILFILSSPQILQDELDNEKGERIRLEAIIDDLKKRPDTSAAVTAAVGFRKRTKTPIEGKWMDNMGLNPCIHQGKLRILLVVMCD